MESVEACIALIRRYKKEMSVAFFAAGAANEVGLGKGGGNRAGEMEDEVREHRDPSVETGTASSGPAEDPAGMSPDEAKGVDLQAFASSADIVPTTRERKDSEHENDAGAESNGSLLAEDLLEPEVEATPLANDKTLAFDPWDKLITICPITGSLNYKGIPQLDLFRNEGDARAYLTANLGLRIVNVVKGDAILGSFVSGSQFNVCLVTKSETCMCLPSGESVYNINEVKWVPVKLAYPIKLSDLQKVLEKYAEAPEELFDRLKRKYGDEPPPEESSPAGDTSAAAEGVREEEQPTHANLCLITRRWRRYPGTRFNARGIDQTGAPANELECELIMSTQHTWASFIWRRGSVPVGWYSSLASNIKMGQPAFCIKESPFDHSYKYWDHLANRFAGWGEDGKPPPISFEGAWRLVAGPLKQYGISHGAVKSSSEFDGENALVSMRSPVRAAGKGDREKKPGVGAFGVIRGLVSQQKLRFTEGDFNLDLTYITPKLIAMGFPSHGAEGYYRNRVDDVERFFASRHAGHFRIYNLCTEREYDNANRFGGCYRRWPFEDHNAPAPIGMIPDLVKDATSYLAEDPKNVIAAHCKAGKGRTGVMLSALLMAGAAPDLVPPYSATAAMGFFGAARTKDGLGVTIPSQRRYIQYYETMLKHHNGQVPPKAAFQITKIVIQSPVRTGGNSPTLYVLIHEGPKFVKSQMGSQYFERDETRLMCDSRKIEPPQQAGARFTLFDFHAEKDRQGNVPIVTGDTKITFVATRSILRGDESLFHVWFNTSFIDSEAVARGDPLRFTKSELDKACKDEKHAAIRRDLQVEVYLQPVGRKGKLSEKEVRTPLQKPPSADFAVRKTSSDDKLASSTKDRQKDDTVDDGLHDGKDRVTSVVDVIEDDEEEEESPESPMTESSLEHKGTNSSMRLSFTARNDDDEDLETTREEIVNYLAEAFVANGDVCSFLYTNTPATHTAAIRELSPRLAQAQSNMALSVMRRYQNTVHDNNRHNGFFAFLGLLKKPRTPPTVHSERGAAVISEVPHARMTAADASVLLHSPPSGEFPWVAPAVEAVSFTIVMPPTVSEVTEV
eukprot:gene4685-7192_t